MDSVGLSWYSDAFLDGIDEIGKFQRITTLDQLSFSEVCSIIRDSKQQKLYHILRTDTIQEVYRLRLNIDS